MKKLASILLAVIMVVSVTFTAKASLIIRPQEVITSGDFMYTILDDGTAEITDYIGFQRVVTVPEFIDGYMVTSIGYEAFAYNLYPEPLMADIAQTGASQYVSISEIILPYTITRIGERAFYCCENLSKVTIPFTVTYIGGRAFDYTPWLESQEDGCLYINDVLYCYKGDMPENTEMVIKNGTVQICSYAFQYCDNLSNVTFPKTLKDIGEFTFYNCSNLEKAIIPDSVESIGEYAFCGCTGITEIKIPSSLNRLANSVFRECDSLTEVVIPETVTEIMPSAFGYCKNLASITIPSSVEKITGAFDGTLWYKNQPDGCIYIYNFLYEYKGKMPPDTKMVIKDGTTEICSHAFYKQYNLVEVEIPSSVTIIGVEAFRYSGLESAVVRDSVKSMGLYAFSQGITLYGDLGSEAQEYSKTPRFEVDFRIIGDVDSDKILSVLDATGIQRAVAYVSEVKDMKAADFDGDYNITIMDATAIQKYLVKE